MLPTYTWVALYLGAVYTFDPLGRNKHNDGLALLRLGGIPVALVGLVFLAAGVLMAVSFYRPEKRVGTHRQAFVFALYVTAGVMALWTLVYLGSVLFAGAPLTAPVWPFLATQACRASAKSLLLRER